MGGSSYYVEYIVRDDCDREASCTQKLTLVSWDNENKHNCIYPQNWFTGSRVNPNYSSKFMQDVQKLIAQKTCDELKNLIQGGVVDMYNEWASRQILGNEISLANGIARRGNIQIALSKISDIELAIQAIEAAIYGDANELRDIIAPEALKTMATYLAGTATPASLITAVKQLGSFAEYLNRDILRINLNTFASMAPNDPDFFDADHFLRTYAGLEDLKHINQDQIDRFRYRHAIYEYAKYCMNDYRMPNAWEVWDSQNNLNAIRTATRAMLNEVCRIYQEKIKVKNYLDQLKKEQSMLERFKNFWDYFQNYDCIVQEQLPPCADIPNITVITLSNGQKDCDCLPPFKWSPDQTKCVSVAPCNFNNAELVFQNEKWECDCISGYVWNADRTSCVPEVPDCESIKANSEPVWNPSTNSYDCRCIQGYEPNPTTGNCDPIPPDCNAILANSEPLWNASVQAYECHCVQGFTYNASTNKCEPIPPDCNAILANSETCLESRRGSV